LRSGRGHGVCRACTRHACEDQDDIAKGRMVEAAVSWVWEMIRDHGPDARFDISQEVILN